MTYQVREITQKDVWESFGGSSRKSFLHSWNWGEFQKLTGEKIFRLGIFAVIPDRKYSVSDQGSEDALVGIALIIKVCAKRGSFLFCPHGPLLSNWEDEAMFRAFFHSLKDLGRKQRVSFIRISPFLEASEAHERIFRSHGFREAPIHMMHPEITWNLDLKSPVEDLLMGMRKTTRYLVKKAGKIGVEVLMRTDPEAVSIFYDIHKDTVLRQHFVPFSLDYLQKEFQAFQMKLPALTHGVSCERTARARSERSGGSASASRSELIKKDGQIVIFLGKYQGKILSGAVVVFYGDTAFYHHGASLSKFREIPASYLIQWEIIKEAKKRGCTLYNFWGIAPDTVQDHPWAGLSLFKKGFGGYSEQFVHVKDFILKPSYWITWMIEKVRCMKRGL